MSEFKNKVALITGASGAIGKDIATTLNKSGALVILCGTKIDVLENIARDLPSLARRIRRRVDCDFGEKPERGVPRDGGAREFAPAAARDTALCLCR